MFRLVSSLLFRSVSFRFVPLRCLVSRPSSPFLSSLFSASMVFCLFSFSGGGGECRSDRPFHNHTQCYVRSAEKMARFHLKCESMGLTDPQVRRRFDKAPRFSAFSPPFLRLFSAFSPPFLRFLSVFSSFFSPLFPSFFRGFSSLFSSLLRRLSWRLRRPLPSCSVDVFFSRLYE